MLQMLQRKNVRIIIVLIILGIVGYYGYKLLSNNNGQLTASGTIEAVELNIAPEQSGKVKEVLVEEGQQVKAGDPVFILEGTILEQQRKVALTSLESSEAASQTAKTTLDIAQAQYQVALQAALAQDKTVRLEDWYSEDQQQFDQPNWFFTRAEQTQAAQGLVDDARKALEDAKAKLTEVEHSSRKADFLAAEKRLLNARMTYLVTKGVDKRAQNAIVGDAPITAYNIRNCAKDKGYRYARPEIMNQEHGCTGDLNLTLKSRKLYDDAKAELEDAQLAYKKLLGTKDAREVLQARADISVAQENYYAFLDYLREVQTGDQSPSVTAAQGTVNQAQATYDQSLKTVAQAQANLDLLDAQLSKLTVYAPMEGVILQRNVEVGDFVQPGASALSMANLNDLTITVYVAEDHYGDIFLGQGAEVSIDSFPGETFTATVTYISDEAEFTPRNVQSVEGRSNTVYAIKLKVSDPKGKLKLGMPADVVFKAK